ncbi:hypothetical protein TNCV_2482751 [Trichonephila clavipes]|uniref:Uncharacterized protein n=1 Tax=Trichonephila clavipes TaxID=2585209 RepID=A0A8X6VZA3_TRICX|nr:hypothetical protein TNCV_2482751 [Trichonephila clavipes]
MRQKCLGTSGLEDHGDVVKLLDDTGGVIHPFKVTIDAAENHDMAAHIVIDPPMLDNRKETITIIRLCRCPPNVPPFYCREKCEKRIRQTILLSSTKTGSENPDFGECDTPVETTFALGNCCSAF